jgi:hypothetical protein
LELQAYASRFKAAFFTGIFLIENIFLKKMLLAAKSFNNLPALIS